MLWGMTLFGGSYPLEGHTLWSVIAAMTRWRVIAHSRHVRNVHSRVFNTWWIHTGIIGRGRVLRTPRGPPGGAAGAIF